MSAEPLMDAAPIIDVLRQALAGAPAGAVTAVPAVDMPTIAIDRAHLADACAALRTHPDLQFSFLSDVTATDLAPAEPRFEVVYHLVCLGEAYVVPEAGTATAAPARRLRVKVRLAGDEARVPSVVGVWPAANWLEREVFDLFGIAFEGHPDLRRVLMPDDWVGYPLRKDYPVQIRKDTASWSPLELSPEEFAANVRARQELAHRQAESRPPRTDGD